MQVASDPGTVPATKPPALTRNWLMRWKVTRVNANFGAHLERAMACNQDYQYVAHRIVTCPTTGDDWHQMYVVFATRKTLRGLHRSFADRYQFTPVARGVLACPEFIQNRQLYSTCGQAPRSLALECNSHRQGARYSRQWHARLLPVAASTPDPAHSILRLIEQPWVRWVAYNVHVSGGATHYEAFIVTRLRCTAGKCKAYLGDGDYVPVHGSLNHYVPYNECRATLVTVGSPTQQGKRNDLSGK